MSFKQNPLVLIISLLLIFTAIPIAAGLNNQTAWPVSSIC